MWPSSRRLSQVLTVSLVLATGLLGVGHAAAAKWTGASLSLPPGISSTEFLGVDCWTSTDCTAVGKDGASVGGAFAETLEGSTWTFASKVTRNPGEKNAVFKGVSCWQGHTCMAVGSYGTSTTPHVPAPMAQKREGEFWYVYKIAIPSGYSQAELNSVSCVEYTEWCAAVGYKMKSGDDKPFTTDRGPGEGGWIERSNTEKPNASLNGVSCLSTSLCIAVGSTKEVPLVEIWNGTSWSAPAEQPGHTGNGTNAVFRGIDCTYLAPPNQTEYFCMAAGTFTEKLGETNYSRPFFDTYHKDPFTLKYQWYNGPAIGLGSYKEILANGVSCVSEKECFIVGEGRNGSTLSPWAGEWVSEAVGAQSISLVAKAEGARLFGIDCFAAQSCKAVGWSLFGGSASALVETVSP